MAQAARLSLRLQKELKLLISDPPPWASFPLLSDDDNLLSSSLSSIEARIEGPEGTVYSKGVFTVKIQIPERYPFQPPNVTFVTPIYHPNIDNGGRICLDILNLPPKGAWRPSLNISTVLTSIGLLLTEPNPDDGLMAETSREYKYNRQAFDENARSWTERYANAGASGISAKQNMMEAEAHDENGGSCKKLRLIGEKLSLKSAALGESNVIPSRRLSLSKSAALGENNVIPSRCLSLSSSKEAFLENQKLDKGSSKEAFLENQKPDKGSWNALETIIVSDSEESDDEDSRDRLRLPLFRKQIGGKRKDY